jgi:hypothetical protein
MFALRVFGSHPTHWVPIVLLALAGVVVGVFEVRAILRSKDALFTAGSKEEVEAVLGTSRMIFLGAIAGGSSVAISQAYGDDYRTSLTSFFALAASFFLVRLIAIYRLNRRFAAPNDQPVA